jgi:hypothetical protein
MFVRIIKSYRDIVAICDSELLGKKFEEGDFQLDVKESFYKGEKMNEKQVLNVMIKMSGEDATFNIIGKKSVDLAISTGIISRQGIKTIQGIPFAMVLM